MKNLIYTLACILLHFGSVHAVVQRTFSDTVRVDLPTTERRFLSHNLALIAQKLTIEERKANAAQAGLWDNPSMSLEQNIYNQETGKYFPTDRDGQTAFEVQQVFLLGGKRGKRVEVETINAEIADHNFHDLLRTLRYELRTSFYDLYYAQLSLGVYDKEIEQMTNTVRLFQMQYDKGNVSEKELIRLKALMLSMESERKELNMQVIEKIGDLSLLTGDTTHAYIVPLAKTKTIDSLALFGLSIDALIDTAFEHRSDLKALEASTRLEEENLSLQHALAIPDVKLGFMYDRNASYIPEYKALTLEVDLPLFNRNQGNIEAAKYRLESSRAQLEQYKQTVKNDVRKAYLHVREIEGLYRNFDAKFAADFDTLTSGVVRNFEKRNISLLEFIDFFESYKNTMVQFHHIQSERMEALEELNDATNTIWFGE